MPLNLDKLAAEHAQAMVEQARQKAQEVKKPVETLERLATKALGVLQSQGVYACILFLYSRTSDEAKVAPFIRSQLLEALKSTPGLPNPPQDEASKVLSFFTNEVTGGSLDTLLLVRDLYEQTLIYARYHAKALGA